MTQALIEKIKNLPRLRLLIILLVIWQYFCVAGIGLLNWPQYLIWVNLGLLLGFILICPVYESLLLLILSIPFSVALPNAYFDALPMWRILYLALFIVWLIKEKKFKFKEIHFLPWDKFLAIFAAIGLTVSLIFAPYKAQAIKEVVFWLNIYFFYIVLINSVRGKQHIFEIIRYVLWSLTIIVALGFAQLFGTFFTSLDTFWVFWAANITKLYYGADFASVSLYSNSWFSYVGARELRMFSIMPDSQSFAYISLFGLALGTALTHSVFKHVRKWLWSGIRFSGMAIILSGTRAVWVGMIVPFLAVAWAYRRNFQKHLAEKFLWPFIIIFALFAVSPLINKGLHFLRVESFKENFLSRAASIYDLNDTSNRGRIAIWEHSSFFALTHPLGMGFGNFMVSVDGFDGDKTYNEAAGQINERYNLPAKYVSAHSLYLQVLVETGILGFIVFMMFWGRVCWYFWRFVKHYHNKHDFLIYFVAQALITVLWVLAASIFDITLLNDKVLMFFLINIGLAGLIVKRYQEYEVEE